MLVNPLLFIVDSKREVYFNVRCKIFLKNYLDEREDENPALFVNGVSQQQRMKETHIRHIVKRISNGAGINAYQFRDNYEVLMNHKGVPTEIIQSFLGRIRKEKSLLVGSEIRH